MSLSASTTSAVLLTGLLVPASLLLATPAAGEPAVSVEALEVACGVTLSVNGLAAGAHPASLAVSTLDAAQTLVVPGTVVLIGGAPSTVDVPVVGLPGVTAAQEYRAVLTVDGHAQPAVELTLPACAAPTTADPAMPSAAPSAAPSPAGTSLPDSAPAVSATPTASAGPTTSASPEAPFAAPRAAAPAPSAPAPAPATTLSGTASSGVLALPALAVPAVVAPPAAAPPPVAAPQVALPAAGIGPLVAAPGLAPPLAALPGLPTPVADAVLPPEAAPAPVAGPDPLVVVPASNAATDLLPATAVALLLIAGAGLRRRRLG